MKSPKKSRPAYIALDSRRKKTFRPLLELLEDRNAPGDAVGGLSLLGATETTQDQPFTEPVYQQGATFGGLYGQQLNVGYSAGDPGASPPSVIVTSPTQQPTGGAVLTVGSPTTFDPGLTGAVGVVGRDRTPPEIELDIPDFSTSTSLMLGVSASDNVRLFGTVAVDVDLNGDGAFRGREVNYRIGRLTAGSTDVSLGQLTHGMHAIRARVRDAAGNVGVATTATVVDPNAGQIGDPVLLQLVASYQAAAAQSSDGTPDASFFQGWSASNLLFDRQGRVGIVARAVHSQWTSELRGNLENLGMTVIYQRPTHGHVVGFIDIGRVPSLTSLPHFATAMGIQKPIREAGAVPGQTEVPLPDGAADAMRVVNFRNTTGFTGQGQMVGVISDSADLVPDEFLGIPSSQASEDLPPNVFDLLELLDPGDATDEGRAMLEIIHDIAPGAGLSFASGVAGIDIALDILTTPSIVPGYPGATVVVDDLSFFGSPIYNDGIFAQAIDQSVLTKNIVYAGSAGNAGSWGAEFTNIGTRWISNNFDPLRVPIHDDDFLHNGIYFDFDPGPGVDLFANITLTGADGLTAHLHWDQPYVEFGSFLPQFQVQNDLDLYLVNLTTGSADFGEIVASGIVPNKLSDTAQETLVSPHPNGTTLGFPGDDGTPQYGIAIRKIGSGPNPTRLRLTRRGGAETHTSIMQYQSRFTNPAAPLLGFPTIFGNHQASQMLSTAAMPWYAQAANEYEGFTSSGRATILFNEFGTRLTTPITRLKPDITGMDGLNTTFFGADITNDSDLFPNFFGTSAAAPTVAAIAALIRSQAPGVSGAQITQHMRTRARDVTGPGDLQSGFDPSAGPAGAGFDVRTGFGLAQAVPFVTPPTPVPPPPGGGTGIAGPPDRFEPNNSSNVATLIDVTTVFPPYTLVLPGLTIHQSLVPDRDFFRVVGAKSGFMTVQVDAATTAGDLDLFVYRVTSTGTLILLASAQTRAAAFDEQVTFNVPVGQALIIQVSGRTAPGIRNIGDYDLIISQ